MGKSIFTGSLSLLRDLPSYPIASPWFRHYSRGTYYYFFTLIGLLLARCRAVFMVLQHVWRTTGFSVVLVFADAPMMTGGSIWLASRRISAHVAAIALVWKIMRDTLNHPRSSDDFVVLAKVRC